MPRPSGHGKELQEQQDEESSISNSLFYFMNRFYLHHMRKFVRRIDGKLAILENVLQNKPSSPTTLTTFPAGKIEDCKVR